MTPSDALDWAIAIGLGLFFISSFTGVSLSDWLNRPTSNTALRERVDALEARLAQLESKE